jgi:hypothetical protein
MVVFMAAEIKGQRINVRVGELPVRPDRPIEFGFFLSGYFGVAKFLNVQVETAIETPEKTAPRSEMRLAPTVQPVFPSQKIVQSATVSQGGAAVFLPLSAIDRFIGKNFIPSGARMVFVAEHGEDVRSLEAYYRPYMNIYRFCIIKSDTPIAKIGLEARKGQSVLRNLKTRAARKLGIPLSDLGKPVFINGDYQFDMDSKPLDQEDSLFMQADEIKLLKDPAYRMAYLMTASCLSKQTVSWISGLAYNTKNMIVLSDGIIQAFQQDYANLSEMARSA